MSETLLDMLKHQLGILLTDVTQDPALVRNLNIAGALVETYLDRIVMKRAIEEKFAYHVGTVTLQNTPLGGSTVVTMDGTQQLDYSTFEHLGMVYLTRDGTTPYMADWGGFHQVTVAYEAGYDPMPTDLSYAIVLTAVEIHDGEGGGGAAAGLEVTSMSLADVGTIRYGSTGSKDTGASGGGIIPAGALAILGLYRRMRA